VCNAISLGTEEESLPSLCVCAGLSLILRALGTLNFPMSENRRRQRVFLFRGKRGKRDARNHQLRFLLSLQTKMNEVTGKSILLVLCCQVGRI